MKELLPQFEFCVVDLETTGLDPSDGSGIIEVAGVKIQDGKIGNTFQEFANPGHSIPEEITRITGLTDDDIEGAPATESVLENFNSFMAESILIAHNARFDLSFLRTYSPEPLETEYIDTLRLARHLLGTEKHSLTYLAETLNLTLTNAHRALHDAKATAELFIKLTEKISQPKDYFRCKLPDSIMEKAPFDVSTPEPQINNSQNIPKSPPLSWILYGLYELDSSLGINKLSKILSGSNSKAVKKYNDLTSYGQLSSYTQKEIKQVIEQTIEENLVTQTGDNYPVLVLTETGIDHLRESAQVA